jgi:hypothetical protein
VVDEQTPAAPPASAPSSSPSANPPASPPAAPSASASPPATPSSPPSLATPEWKRPAYFPETVKSEADAEKFVREHVSFKAAEDSRKLTLPQKPEDYKLGLPKDFKAPQGIEFVPNEQDPLLPQARAFAQKYGLPQEGFEELVGLKAAIEIGNKQQIDNAKAAEVQKLGVNGTARKTAVDTWLIAELGEDLGKHVSMFTYTAKQVEAFEKLMAKARTQGASSFTHQNREPPNEPGRVTPEQYNKMSPAAKLDYARQFPQVGMNGARTQ